VTGYLYPFLGVVVSFFLILRLFQTVDTAHVAWKLPHGRRGVNIPHVDAANAVKCVLAVAICVSTGDFSFFHTLRVRRKNVRGGKKVLNIRVK